MARLPWAVDCTMKLEAAFEELWDNLAIGSRSYIVAAQFAK